MSDLNRVQFDSPPGIAVLSTLSGLLSGFLYGAFYERWMRQSYLRWRMNCTTVPPRFVCVRAARERLLEQD